MDYEEARELIMDGIMRNACIPKEKDWWNGALLKATEALEKQIPNKPKFIGEIPVCHCGMNLSKEEFPYCGYCGQRIDYSEVE